MKSLLSVSCVCLLLLGLSQSLPIFLRRKWGLDHGGMFLSLDSAPSNNTPAAQWFNQSVDHLNSSTQNDVTWKQRYWVNDTFWDKENGPVFLMIEGEGEANPKWVLEGEMMVLAQKYSALALQVEHRFYGQSQPFTDLSIENLHFLSSEQALADLDSFHRFMVSSLKLTDSNRWVAFGGSYSGALAAWFRIKYPNDVMASVASSAPVQAVLDFYRYLEVVGASLKQARNGEKCVATIAAAFEMVDGLVKDQTQWPYLAKTFHLNKPIESDEDGKLMALSLAGMFMGVVQYNNDSRSEKAYDMNILCDVMTNETLGHPMDRLVYLANVSESFDPDVNFQDYLNDFMNTTVDPAMGGRQWFYQTCSEFGYFQTSDSSDQPFGSLIDIDLYTIACEKVFGITQAQTQTNVLNTNNFYGGKNITGATNIVFPNGSIDPWHALGITTNVSNSLIAVFINGTAHCANMYPSNPYDRPQLVEARNQIDDILGRWLKS